MKRLQTWLVAVCCSLPVGFGLGGCGTKGAAPAGSGTGAGDTTSGEATVATEIEDQLRSALYQLQPEHLNIDSRLDDAISVLNNWWEAIEEARLKPTGVSAAELPTQRLLPELVNRLERDTFDSEDGRYIRACYLSRKISEQVGRDAPTEKERVLAIFEWVCRNVALRAADEVNYPVSLYEALIIGRGLAEDRAVVLASILKQLRIDSVILRQKADAANREAPWLFGAVAGSEMYLFDLRLGLPVPVGDAPAAQRLQTVATLADVLAHPEWLHQLSPRADQPYGLSLADRSALQIEAVTFVDGWSSRIWTVEQMLPAESLCVLYDAPSQFDALPGVFERIAAAIPDVEATDVGLWNYPEQRAAQFTKPSPAEVQALQMAISPMLCPVEFEPSRNGGTPQRVETMRHLRIRTDQLVGLRSSAVSQYITIRQLSVTPPPEPLFGPIYQRAADDAFFWSCVCKYENGDLESVSKQLADYLKRYRRSGQWAYEARSLLARTLQRMGEVDEAVQTLRAQESDDPYRDQHAILVKLWTERPTESTPAAAE